MTTINEMSQFSQKKEFNYHNCLTIPEKDEASTSIHRNESILLPKRRTKITTNKVNVLENYNERSGQSLQQKNVDGFKNKIHTNNKESMINKSSKQKDARLAKSQPNFQCDNFPTCFKNKKGKRSKLSTSKNMKAKKISSLTDIEVINTYSPHCDRIDLEKLINEIIHTRNKNNPRANKDIANSSSADITTTLIHHENFITNQTDTISNSKGIIGKEKQKRVVNAKETDYDAVFFDNICVTGKKLTLWKRIKKRFNPSTVTKRISGDTICSTILEEERKTFGQALHKKQKRNQTFLLPSFKPTLPLDAKQQNDSKSLQDRITLTPPNLRDINYEIFPCGDIKIARNLVDSKYQNNVIDCHNKRDMDYYTYTINHSQKQDLNSCSKDIQCKTKGCQYVTENMDRQKTRNAEVDHRDKFFGDSWNPLMKKMFIWYDNICKPIKVDFPVEGNFPDKVTSKRSVMTQVTAKPNLKYTRKLRTRFRPDIDNCGSNYCTLIPSRRDKCMYSINPKSAECLSRKTNSTESDGLRVIRSSQELIIKMNKLKRKKCRRCNSKSVIPYCCQHATSDDKLCRCRNYITRSCRDIRNPCGLQNKTKCVSNILCDKCQNKIFDCDIIKNKCARKVANCQTDIGDSNICIPNIRESCRNILRRDLQHKMKYVPFVFCDKCHNIVNYNIINDRCARNIANCQTGTSDSIICLPNIRSSRDVRKHFGLQHKIKYVPNVLCDKCHNIVDCSMINDRCARNIANCQTGIGDSIFCLPDIRSCRDERKHFGLPHKIKYVPNVLCQCPNNIIDRSMINDKYARYISNSQTGDDIICLPNIRRSCRELMYPCGLRHTMKYAPNVFCDKCHNNIVDCSMVDDKFAGYIDCQRGLKDNVICLPERSSRSPDLKVLYTRKNKCAQCAKNKKYETVYGDDDSRTELLRRNPFSFIYDMCPCFCRRKHKTKLYDILCNKCRRKIVNCRMFEDKYSKNIARRRFKDIVFCLSKRANKRWPMIKVLYRRKKRCAKCVKREKYERVYKGDKLYVSSLRRRPYLCIYKMCPRLYPHCLSYWTMIKNIAHVFLFMLSMCVWCPCLIMIEICRFIFFCSCRD